jgi:hypothetical protein
MSVCTGLVLGCRDGSWRDVFGPSNGGVRETGRKRDRGREGEETDESEGDEEPDTGEKPKSKGRKIETKDSKGKKGQGILDGIGARTRVHG